METTPENRANLKVFNSFQDEYKAMMDEMLSEVKTREEVIETLSSKLNINEQKQREYRAVFSNVGQLEDKLKKMDLLYADKLKTVFNHYSRTVAVINQEKKKVFAIADKLKGNQISASKASSNLSAVIATLESQVNCFEKFFNKYSSVGDLHQVVETYLKSKEEAKKGIDRVIYIEELAKFKDKAKQDSPVEMIRSGYEDRMDSMRKRFQGLHKSVYLNDKNQTSQKNLYMKNSILGTSQTKLQFTNESLHEINMSHRRISGYSDVDATLRQSNQASRTSFRLNNGRAMTAMRIKADLK